MKLTNLGYLNFSTTAPKWSLAPYLIKAIYNLGCI